MYEPIQQAISLRKFTGTYGSKLPRVIAASESVYGVHDNILQSGQQFEAYFMKETPVITMKVAERRYTVPVNSSYKFGILYNPRNDDLSTARIGHQFEKAADLMKAVPLPSVVYVSKECTGLGERGEESIKVGTLLLVKGIERHHHSGKANMLKCLKATYNNEVELEEVYFSGKRKGYFSTQESLIRFPLSVLLKHFEVPINVSIYHGDVNALHKKFNDKSAVIESKEISTLTSVIVSLHSTSQCPPSKLLEMHSEISMDFYVSCIEGKEMDELKQKAISLSHSLSPEQAKVIFTLGLENPLQRDLFLPVNNKEWLHEVHSFNDTVYETMVTPPAATKPVASPLVPFAILPQPIVELPSTMGAMKSKGRASKRQPSLDCSHSPQELTMAVQENPKPLVSKKPTDDGIQRSMARVRNIETPKDKETHVKTGSKAFLDSNKSLLSNYNPTNMADLLVNMGLEKYAKKFEEEKIDGRLLFQIDDGILKEELGMTKIHCLRLMMIINGDKCVSNYI